jgi:hypothetical protein
MQSYHHGGIFNGASQTLSAASGTEGCTDVDECAASGTNTCHANARCIGLENQCV